MGREFVVTFNNLIAFLIFFTAGILTLVLTLKGQLSMAKSEEFAKIIQNAGGIVNQYAGNNLLLNILFIGFILYLIYFISKEFRKGR